MLRLKSIGNWLKDDYMEGKIEEERRKKKEEERRRKKKKNCVSHVTVLRTCSLSWGGDII